MEEIRLSYKEVREMIYEWRVALSIVVMLGSAFSAGVGITEFNKCKDDGESLKFGLLSVFSIVSIILVANLI